MQTFCFLHKLIISVQCRGWFWYKNLSPNGLIQIFLQKNFISLKYIYIKKEKKFVEEYNTQFFKPFYTHSPTLTCSLKKQKDFTLLTSRYVAGINPEFPNSSCIDHQCSSNCSIRLKTFPAGKDSTPSFTLW